MDVFPILAAAWFAYKKAKSARRRPILWALGVVVVFIVSKVLFAVGFAFIVAFGVESWGWKETIYEKEMRMVDIVSWIGGFIGMLIIYRYLDKVPAGESTEDPGEPPPPPSF